MVLQIGGRLIRSVPSIENGNLDEWFDKYPIICQANVELTQMWHTKMWREKVLFIRQRMQATSDYRENQKVRWIGKIEIAPQIVNCLLNVLELKANLRLRF